MAEITVIPLLNAQQLSMQGLAQGAITRPETAQALTQQLALDLLRQDAEKVEKPEIGAKSGMVGDDEGGGAAFGGEAGQRERRQPQEEPEEAPVSNPLVGKLLNVKV